VRFLFGSPRNSTEELHIPSLQSNHRRDAYRICDRAFGVALEPQWSRVVLIPQRRQRMLRYGSKCSPSR